jgi:two-component system, cell cycle sensor histidine kinase and response regulator CckA
MAVEAETAGTARERRGSGWSIDRRGFPGSAPGPMWWLREAGWKAPAIAVSTSVLAAFCVAQIVAGSAVDVTIFAAISLAALGVVGFAALKAHAALAARLDILAGALDAVPEAQVVVTSDGRPFHANAAYHRLFPGKGEAALERIGQVLAADPQAASALGRLSDQLAAGAPAEAKLAVGVADDAVAGGLRWSAALLAGGSGHRLWSLRSGGASDQTQTMSSGEHREAAETLSRGLFQRLFANAPVGIAVVDRLGRFIEANRAAGELFGASPQELIGSELVGLLNEGERAAIAARLAAADGEADREPIEIRLGRPRERTIVLLLSRFDPQEGESSPPATGSGDAAATEAVGNADLAGGLMLYLIDVTEQKNLEAQFVQSQKMQAVGQLAGGVAHDFNNLLTAIIGFCDLLLLRSRPGDPAFADIMQIKQNANRAANLVRQLLAFSRQQTLQPRVIDITDVLVELSHLLRRLIGENITLEFVHGRDLGLVKVDQGQLEQVVINLAVNARDAMPNGGRLTIRTANVCRAQALRRGHEVMPAGDYVLIEVADTGIGISPDNLARIFEPFFSTKEVGSGTGLGLSTVYGIVKQTGGFVFVDSNPGAGAAFEIYLPRHQAGEVAAAGRADAAEPPAPKDLTGTGTVILVEDDDAVRMFGARALRSKGYRVIEAKSGETALDLVRETSGKINLLITDVVMPQMDGPALIREVRRIDPDIKVIFISGYTEDAFRQRLGSESDIHFLAKPFSLKQLAIKVKDVIGETAIVP